MAPVRIRIGPARSEQAVGRTCMDLLSDVGRRAHAQPRTHALNDRTRLRRLAVVHAVRRSDIGAGKSRGEVDLALTRTHVELNADKMSPRVRDGQRCGL
jgi:hypothetical protein